MAVNEVSKTRVPTVPHELNVRKFAESRASELDALHAIVANRLNTDFRSQRNKRRRTNGHENRIAKQRFRKKQRTGLEKSSNNDSSKEDDNKVSRRVRRSREFKKNPQSGFCKSGDGTKRLRTHVWHVKRFTLTKLWGFHIPVGLHGSGRGSRAVLKKLKSGVLIHDASYYGTVQLDGQQDTLLAILGSVLVPAASLRGDETCDDLLCGKIFGTAMLRHVGKQCSPPIAPVTYMWRPLQDVVKKAEESLVNDTYDQVTRGCSTFCQIWVWIHAAAFEEAYAALKSACEKHKDTIGGLATCVSLEGQLAKLELLGSEAFQILEKTFRPASCDSKKSHLRKCTCDENKEQGELESATFSKIHQISSSSVLAFNVKDPRLNERILYNSCEGVDHIDIWDASKRLFLPMEENIVCQEKYYQRMKFIALSNKFSRTRNTPMNGTYSQCCPILLLNNEIYKDSIQRCSIILPLSWVKVFWNAFISHGAQAIGLREKQWIASEIRLPYFPLDYPDCDAYWCVLAKEADADHQKAIVRLPSKRPLEIPIPTPWGCAHPKFFSLSSDSGNSLNQPEQVLYKNDVVGNLVRNAGSEANGASFEGVVARTSICLQDWLNSISHSDFFLFPRKKDPTNCMLKFIKDEEFYKHDNFISEMNYGKTPCFLRVILRPYKEGVFEQGAVVCAPRTSDITSWIRSESVDQQLQIPQSSLKSYFMKLPSGNWEHQGPYDPLDKESYRSPVGFVTTGFVCGGKKAVVGAVCEASLLSKLRLEQWKVLPVTQRRKEIFVLVRNLRSTAFRLAFASIVLEQQEQDLSFI